MQDVTLQGKGLAGWSTRDLLVAAVISVVIGVLLIPLMYLFHSLMAVLGPFGNSLTTGLWLIPGIMVPYVIRRPGGAFLGCFLVGLLQGPFSPFGWVILLIQCIVGLFCELPFLLTRYRRYSFLFLLSAGGFGNLAPLVVSYTLYNFARLAPPAQITGILMHIVGGILGALIAKLLTDALVQTGVLNGYAIGRERSKEI